MILVHELTDLGGATVSLSHHEGDAGCRLLLVFTFALCGAVPEDVTWTVDRSGLRVAIGPRSDDVRADGRAARTTHEVEVGHPLDADAAVARFEHDALIVVVPLLPRSLAAPSSGPVVR